MLKVHVWPPHGNMVGHASLSFGSNYVSFWPADAAGKKDLKIKRSHPGHLMAALQEDIGSEGGRQPTNHCDYSLRKRANISATYCGLNI